MDFLREFWQFIKTRKKLWLLPVVSILLLLAGLIVFVQGSALAPLIYTVF
ncbi:hypothetical protein RHDC2_00336 [Rhodocyclaceae bacterium]|nr:hypothetical protein RHDC2_00336 [Rhodocyclaceae bacterium]